MGIKSSLSKNPRYINVKGMASHYDVSVPTIWRWCKKGILPPPIKISAGCSRWDFSNIEEIDSKRKVEK